MKNSSRRGLTIVELMVAMVILFGVGLGAVVYTLTQFNDKSHSYSEEEIMKADASLTAESVMTDIFNAAYLRPHEGLDEPTDLAYNGISGIDGESDAMADHLGACDYQGPPDAETFSILRQTALNAILSPEKTLGPWREVDIAGQGPEHFLNITLHNTGPSNFIFFNGSRNINEILILDGDGAYARRYKVLSVTKKINTDVDPYDNQIKPGNQFSYTQLELEMPRTFTAKVQPPTPSTFVTGSIVYGAQTRDLCIGGNGNVIAHDEVSDTYKNLFTSNAQSYVVSRFSFEFLNLKPGVNLSGLTWFSFGALDDQWRACQNVARLSLQIAPRNPHAELINIERVFYLNSTASSRPSYCDTYVPPACGAGGGC
jgi:hypothetical protein